MRIDFWNNPLVITAFRVKNRYGGLYLNLTLYFFLLGGACIAAWYLIPEFNGKPVPPRDRLHMIFVGLLLFQTALSACWALVAASTAMTAEIAGGTLDYQRLTSLTPAQVLTGKLLGPPATAYLAILGSVPFTFGLWSLDASGISFMTLLLLYVQQLATALMAAAIGLVKRLGTVSTRKNNQEMSGMGCLLILFFLWPISFGITMLPALMSQQRTAATVGLLLPVGPFTGLLEHDDPWHYALSFFGTPLPFLLVTPLVQFAVGALCFVVMIRRLTNTVSLPLSKPIAYALLAAMDVIAAGVLFESALLRPANPLGPRSIGYWLCHALAVFFLDSLITPDRELLRSWLWRFRGRCSLFRDLCWHDRSGNILVLLTFCMIGIVIYILLVAAPAVVLDGWTEAQPVDRLATHPAVLACILILSLGTLKQAGTFLVGRGGGALVLIPVVIDLVVLAAGEQTGMKWLRNFSVAAHWLSWQAEIAPLAVLPALSVQFLVFLCAWTALRRGLRRERLKIEGCKREMGVL